MDNYIAKIKKLFQTGFFHIFGSSVINKIITFLSSVVLVRILTKEEYGSFAYAFNIYNIILLFNALGMESASLQMASEKSGDEEYVNKIYAYAARFGILFDFLLIGVLLGIAFFAPLKIKNAKYILVLLCCLPIVQFLYGELTALLRTQKRNKEFGKISNINSIFYFLISAVGALIFREYGMILGHYIAYIASVLIGCVAFKVHIPIKKVELLPKDKKAIFSIAIVSMCNNGLSHLLYLLDMFVLGLVDPTEAVLASYKVATMIPTALAFIPASLVIYIYPMFAEHHNDKKWCLKRYKQIVCGFGAFNAGLSVILFILGPTIIRIFYGQDYMDAISVFRILVVNYFISGTFRTLSGNLLVTQRKLKFNLLVAIVSGIVNIIADFLFIQWWGSVGAAIATVLVVLVSSVMSTGYLIYVLKKEK